MAIKLITPPAILPVSIDDAKIHERIDIEDAANDASILSLLTASTQLAENYTRRAFITQTWLYQTANLSPIISIPRPPFIDIDTDVLTGIQEVYTTNNYNIRTPVLPNTLGIYPYFTDNTYEPARFTWSGFQLPNQVGGGWGPWCGYNYGCSYGGNGYTLSMQYTAGYGPLAIDVPWEIKEGILQIFGSLYENRESQLIPGGAQQLLSPYKVEYL